MPASDRARVLSTLDAHARTRFSPLRMRAIALLCLDTALRLRECLALQVEQVTERSGDELRIVGEFHLGVHQAKGVKARPGRAGWTSARLIVIPRRARAALLAYVREARKRGWLGSTGPLWVQALSDEGKRDGVKPRAVQKSWRLWQLRAGIADPYRFHDTRHTSLTRLGEVTSGDPYVIAAAAGHGSMQTSMSYVHVSEGRLKKALEAASEDA